MIYKVLAATSAVFVVSERNSIGVNAADTNTSKLMTLEEMKAIEYEQKHFIRRDRTCERGIIKTTPGKEEYPRAKFNVFSCPACQYGPVYRGLIEFMEFKSAYKRSEMEFTYSEETHVGKPKFRIYKVQQFNCNLEAMGGKQIDYDFDVETPLTDDIYMEDMASYQIRAHMQEFGIEEDYNHDPEEDMNDEAMDHYHQMMMQNPDYLQ